MSAEINKERMRGKEPSKVIINHKDSLHIIREIKPWTDEHRVRPLHGAVSICRNADVSSCTFYLKSQIHIASTKEKIEIKICFLGQIIYDSTRPWGGNVVYFATESYRGNLIATLLFDLIGFKILKAFYF